MATTALHICLIKARVPHALRSQITYTSAWGPTSSTMPPELLIQNQAVILTPAKGLRPRHLWNCHSVTHRIYVSQSWHIHVGL